MKQNAPSLTACKVAAIRAAHQIFDFPQILDDPMALRIIGTRNATDIRSDARKFRRRLQRYLRAIVVARSRFAEDQLSAAIGRGIRQYVILGAGLDTFAYRSPYSTETLGVFEVDHPATQQWKRSQLHKTGISIPGNLVFVPADFERLSLADQLKNAGFKTDQSTLFSLLGVTMYLTHETVMDTMKAILSISAPGSEIVFDYVIPPSSQNILRRLIFRLLAHRVERAGEPWKCFFDPDTLVSDLKTIGFSRVETISPKEINERFFKGRRDKLMVGNFGHLITAGVSRTGSI